MAGPIATSADEAQRQILAIGAQQGDQGVAQFNQALSDVQSIQKEALDRAGLQVSQIGAPTGSQQEMAALFTRPTTTALQQLTVGKANFQANVNRAGYAGLVYQNNMKTLEPLVDKYIAAKAAADAAGSGGGGSGGGGSGGGGGSDKPLSDTALRTELTGAAAQTRESDIAAAADALKQAGKARQAARGKVKQQSVVVRTVVNAAKGRGPKAHGNVTKLARRYQHAPPHSPQKRRLGHQLMAARHEMINSVIGINPSLNALGVARKGAQRAAKVQRGAYANVVGTANTPLGDYARQIGVDAGEDPNRVYGVIGPTQDKSFRLADQSRNKEAGGAVGMFGRPPTLGPRAAAKELHVKPEKAKVMRKSKNYAQLAEDAQAAIRDGKSFDQFRAEVRQAGWFEPRQVPLLNKRGRQKVNSHGTKLTQPAPALGHVANLVLLDYAPAFTR